MKAGRVAVAVGKDQAARAVGVAQAEVRVLHQQAHHGQHAAVALGRMGLQGEPLVQRQRLVAEQAVKPRQRARRQLVAAVDQRAERVQAVGHVAGVLDALVGLAGPHAVAAGGGAQAQHVQRQAGQRAAAAGHRIGCVGAVVLVLGPGPLPVVVQRGGQLHLHGLAHRVDALRIDHVELVGDVVLVGQLQHQGLEGGVQLGVAQHRPQGFDVCIIQRRGACLVNAGSYVFQSNAQTQALPGFPAVEGVAVVRQQVQQLGVVIHAFQFHRGREAAQQRGHRFFVDAGEYQRGFGLGQHGRVAVQQRALRQRQRQRAPVAADQAQAHRDDEGLLARLAGRGGAALRQCQRVAAGVGVIAATGMQHRRAGLAVPALELRQQGAQRAAGVGVGHGLREVVAGDGLAVVALKVQIHAAPEALAAQQGLDHAHHLGAFFVDGGGVEVADFQVFVGAYRVRHGAGVLWELGGAQGDDVLDALDGARAGRAGQVFAEFLVAEHRQAFLERQLEPVAAGDAVASPVVEVLVADDALDGVVVAVGGGGRLGQHVLGVEDVQALVFHGAGVEVAGGHHHEALQVQRQAEAGLVPQHGVDQRAQGVLGLVQVARAHVDLQQVLGAGARRDALLARHQLAGHQREQVAGLLVRVVPGGVVAAIVQVAAGHQVAVGQQHRPARLVGAQGDGVDGHHVRAVQEVGDAAKALRLALGEEVAAAHEQAHQLAVLLGRAGGEDLQLERRVAGRQVFQHQGLAVQAERAGLAAQHDAREVQLVAIQPQRLRRHAGVAAQAHAAEHAGLGRIQVDGQLDAVDPEGRRGVVLTPGHGGLSFTHGSSFLLCFL